MTPLRVMLDARMLRHGGIGTYLRHLIPALAASGAVDHGCLAGAPGGLGEEAPERWCRQPFAAPVYSLQEQWRRPPNPHQASLWHSPHWNLPRRWPGPLVVTVHDLIPLTHLRVTRSPLASPYLRLMLRQIGRRAQAVIADSEAVKRDLCARTSIPPGRVTVIPLGVDPAFGRPLGEAVLAAVLARYRIERPYLLWVGAIRPHKNPVAALRIVAQLRKQYQVPHQFVMVGQRLSWYRQPWQEIRRLNLEAVVHHLAWVADADLPAIYQAASALVIPSLDEGFGLPALEAMAAGCPVIASSIPAFTELVGTAGVLVPPQEIDGWVDHLYNGVFDEDRRRTLQERGRQRAQPFTWDRAADRHLEVYRRALG